MDTDADARARAAIALSEANRPAIMATVEHNYRWVHGNDSDQIHLLDGARQVGTWRYDLEAYYPYDADNGRWGDAQRQPKGAPAPPAKQGASSVSATVQC